MTVDLERAVHDALADILDLAPPPPDGPRDLTPLLDERPDRRIPVLAAAAVLIVTAIVGVVVLRGGSSVDRPASSTPTMPSTPGATTPPADTVVADPLAISLDRWATGTVLAGAGPFVVFDLATLPAGWTIAGGPDGSHRVSDPDPSHYTWGVTLVTDDGRLAGLVADRDGDGPTRSSGTPVTVRGHDGYVDDDRLTWRDDAGVELTVAVADATTDELVDVADRLGVTTTDALATSTPQVGDAPAAGEVVLGGTLEDLRWSVSTSPTDDAALSLNLAGRQFAFIDSHRPARAPPRRRPSSASAPEAPSSTGSRHRSSTASSCASATASPSRCRSPARRAAMRSSPPRCPSAPGTSSWPSTSSLPMAPSCIAPRSPTPPRPWPARHRRRHRSAPATRRAASPRISAIPVVSPPHRHHRSRSRPPPGVPNHRRRRPAHRPRSTSGRPASPFVPARSRPCAAMSSLRRLGRDRRHRSGAHRRRQPSRHDGEHREVCRPR